MLEGFPFVEKNPSELVLTTSERRTVSGLSLVSKLSHFCIERGGVNRILYSLVVDLGQGERGKAGPRHQRCFARPLQEVRKELLLSVSRHLLLHREN